MPVRSLGEDREGHLRLVILHATDCPDERRIVRINQRIEERRQQEKVQLEHRLCPLFRLLGDQRLRKGDVGDIASHMRFLRVFVVIRVRDEQRDIAVPVCVQPRVRSCRA